MTRKEKMLVNRMLRSRHPDCRNIRYGSDHEGFALPEEETLEPFDIILIR